MDTTWVVMSLGVVGFMLTWTGMVVSVTRAITTIKADTSEKLDAETSKIMDRMTGISEHFEQEMQSQDSRFGEVGMSLRQYIANVEKEMHSIEIWNRDNFVLKGDFMKATDRLESAIRTMATDIKMDLREMSKKIDNHNEERT